MTTNPNIETLREILKRDQAIFDAQSKRLMEIQRSSPEDMTSADKNSLHNWDKSIVKDCNRQLLLLEEIESPTVEEREIMQELNKLISLGDHILERRNLVQAELFEKIGIHKKSTNMNKKSAHGAGLSKSPAASSPPTTEEREMDDKDKEHSKDFKTPMEPNLAASSLTASYERTKTAGQPDCEHDLKPPHETDGDVPFDPKDLYAVIKVKPDAPLDDVKKYGSPDCPANTRADIIVELRRRPLSCFIPTAISAILRQLRGLRICRQLVRSSSRRRRGMSLTRLVMSRVLRI